MGSHYSALIMMDFPKDIDTSGIIGRLTNQETEVAFEGTYNPAMLLDTGTVAVCNFKNMLFMQGEVLFGRDNEAEFQEHLKELSTGGRLFHWTVEDTSGTLAFDYVENGSVKRSWWSCVPRVNLNAGNPLPNEPPGKFGSDLGDEDVEEWDIVTVAEGFGFIWDELEEAPCTIYRPKKVEKISNTETSQKPWWRFW
ncbi:hypothetical protein [Geomonas anaerohicana]|uniref:Uncharacterized protein n=1 Tax=Geomonas anaerohicana TaxID=2798583 RepID=A0ABS0YDX5_9BACT|nr:hypothetical protein [Geomonas anaerohicana]MBJ6750492.1 hypothetical protein [Geomonas anaerohicana]